MLFSSKLSLSYFDTRLSYIADTVHPGAYNFEDQFEGAIHSFIADLADFQQTYLTDHLARIDPIVLIHPAANQKA
jgi:hypothetical protein